MTEQTTPLISTESPASWNTKYVDPSGFECMLTLRAGNGAELLKRAGVALGELIKQGCTPVSKGNDKPQPDVTVCELHNAEMKLHSNDKGTWYSHRLADNTYCKGRALNHAQKD
jgi:hypothetical protein